MTTQRLLSVFVFAALLCGGPTSAPAASLDEATARATIGQSPDNVLAALVQVDTTCHREDDLCMDGVRVVQVLLDRNPQGARIAAGSRFLLHVGRGDDPATPAMGDQILFVGIPLNPKAPSSDYTAKAMTVTPSRKDIDELRTVIAGLAGPGTTPTP
jgi:hypothetical protein